MSTFRIRKPARIGAAAIVLEDRPLAETCAAAAADLVRRAYDLNCTPGATVLLGADRDEDGGAVCPAVIPCGHFRINTDAGPMVLHVHEGPPGETLDLAGAVSRYVAETLPVGAYRETVNGRSSVAAPGDRHATLTNWIDGVPPEPNLTMGYAAGRALAELHGVLAGFPDVADVRAANHERTVTVLRIADALADDESEALPAKRRAAVCRAARTLRDAAPANRFYAPDAQPLHGDPTAGNLLVDPDVAVRFLDFEDAGHSFGLPEDELAVLAFRFAALAPDEGRAVVDAVLTGYREVAGGIRIGDLEARIDLYLARAIVLMAGSALAGAPLPREEWDKFETLTTLVRRWSGS